MGKKAAVPDAWDDDWEEAADKAEALPAPLKAEEEEPVVTKAERLAKHAESNKKIWQTAEEPETFHFLAARDNVPLKTEFKPALKVLARKPTPTMVKRIDPVTGMEKLILDDGEDEVDVKPAQLSPEELRLKTQREREEKQKRYDEARARILGTPSVSGASTPGAVTPPNTEDGGKSRTGKGRGRGGGAGSGSGESRRTDNSQPGNKELFDPNYTPKPGGVSIQKRNGEGSRSGRSTPREEEQIIRSPKGPDGSGRGGFGFIRRGGKTS